MAHDASLNIRLREVKQENQSQKLESAYEKSLREIDAICEIESLRRMRLSMMMLEDANDDLHDQLAQDDVRFDEIQATQDDLQSQLEASTQDFERVRGELRLREREIDTLKTELRSLQGVSIDSSKLLSEKLALSRELATLKPEVEHLRAQASSDQNLLSEKLALQRQVSSLQVELEAEKRASQKALAKQEARDAKDGKLEDKLQALQAELAQEKRMRQKLEAEAQKAGADFENKTTVLESRLDAFRNKLRLTKEQLKESQAELQSRAASMARQSDGRSQSFFDVQNPRKRSIAQVDFDSAIGTPGAQPATKKGKRGSTLPGEKSNFSITPFLNRTASVAPESPPPEMQGEQPAPSITTQSDAETDLQASSPSGKPKRKPRAQKPAALGPAKAGKVNSRGRPAKASAAARKASMPPTLDQVAEEEGEDATGEEKPSKETRADDDDDEEPSKKQRQLPPPQKHTFSEDTRPQVSRESVEPTFIKKKRKILGGGSGLGKTIFDDEDGEATKGGDKGLFGAARGIGAFGKKGSLGLGGVKFAPRLGVGAGAGAGGGGMGGFGAFSPLKKDRKAGLSGA